MACLIIAVIGVGAFFFIRNITSQQKEQSISNVLFTAGLGLIVGGFGSFIDKLYQFLVFLMHSQNVDDSLKISNELSKANFPSIIVGFILLGVGLYYSRYIQNKLFILNINGYFDNRIETHHEDLGLSRFEFKEREIDFVGMFRGKPVNALLVQEISSLMKEKIKAFKEESKGVNRGYTGIAPIPFIALAGTHLKRARIDSYYEFDKKISETYYALRPSTESFWAKIFKKKPEYPPLELTTNLQQLDTSRKEAVISISVTTDIPTSDLSQFQQAEIVKLAINTPKDNAIQYTQQLIDYRDKIVQTIIDIRAKMPNLNKIHLVCSSQSCLALEIGRSMEDYRMPPIIIYQFNAHESKKYPWGIALNGMNLGNYVEG